jgi:hypothetical protein
MLVLSWVLAPCGFVGRCQRFGEICCLLLQAWNNKSRNWSAYIGFEEGRLSATMPSFITSALKMETVFFPKCWHPHTKPHGTKPQDDTNITLTAVRISNLIILHTLHVSTKHHNQMWWRYVEHQTSCVSFIYKSECVCVCLYVQD